ncbi:MAG: hypothetical protein ACR2QC_08375, partial [Gammaproteobacteria bacterium]
STPPDSATKTTAPGENFCINPILTPAARIGGNSVRKKVPDFSCPRKRKRRIRLAANEIPAFAGVAALLIS